MDIFRFLNPTSPTKMEQGVIVNKLRTKMWIERYQKLGECTLTGYVKDGLREALPVGCYISHVDTNEIMQVENHEINSSVDKEAEIKITGRTLPKILEERLGGATTRTFPFVDGSTDFYQPTDTPQWQIVAFMNGAIDAGHVVIPTDAVPYITMWSNISGGSAVPARYIKWGIDHLTTVIEMLKANGYGLLTLRPGAYTRNNASIPDENSVFLVYKGLDRSATTVLSYDAGEIESADYFWSIKPKKTLAVVTGKWVGVRVGTGETYDERKMVFVDASSIDNLYNVAPTGSALTQIQNGMSQRGLDVISKMKELNIANVQVSKQGTHLTYRKDYFLGDLLMVNGEYDVAAPFRVSEYVEIDDENGTSGYPTLELP